MFLHKQKLIVKAALVICKLVVDIRPEFQSLTSTIIGKLIIGKLTGEFTPQNERFWNLAQTMQNLAVMTPNYCASKMAFCEGLKKDKCA